MRYSNKFTILILLISVIFSQCDKADTLLQKESTSTKKTQKVALLKIDYQTYKFEGGKELIVNASSTFDISSTYTTPGDFGSVQLYHKESKKKILDGTIIWMGKGHITQPSSFDSVTEFKTISNTIKMPHTNKFEVIKYGGFYPDKIRYSKIWDSKSFASNN